MVIRSLISLFLFIFCSFILIGQEVIFLKNPSFEDSPRHSKTPKGWDNCGPSNQSQPDVHSADNNLFGVEQNPQNGHTFLGLVARQDISYESVGQELTTPILADSCYSISAYLSHSKTMASYLQSNSETNNFSGFYTPIVLSIYGGNSNCDTKVLLAESPPIDHENWVKYNFRFQSKEPLTHLTLECYYAPESETAYNGNILIDNLSPILPIDCEKFEPLVDLDTIVAPHFEYLSLIDPYPKETIEKYSILTLKTIEDLSADIQRKCPFLNYEKGRKELNDNGKLTLLKALKNMEKFEDYRLHIHIDSEDEKMNKRRIIALKIFLKKRESNPT